MAQKFTDVPEGFYASFKSLASANNLLGQIFAGFFGRPPGFLSRPEVYLTVNKPEELRGEGGR
jgi:hypothetical protein